MICSNEPVITRPAKYGIRIENLVVAAAIAMPSSHQMRRSSRRVEPMTSGGRPTRPTCAPSDFAAALAAGHRRRVSIGACARPSIGRIAAATTRDSRCDAVFAGL